MFLNSPEILDVPTFCYWESLVVFMAEEGFPAQMLIAATTVHRFLAYGLSVLDVHHADVLFPADVLTVCATEYGTGNIDEFRWKARTTLTTDSGGLKDVVLAIPIV